MLDCRSFVKHHHTSSVLNFLELPVHWLNGAETKAVENRQFRQELNHFEFNFFVDLCKRFGIGLLTQAGKRTMFPLALNIGVSSGLSL